MNDAPPLLLRKRCLHCGGTGEHSMVAGQPCRTCGGEGYTLTDDGRKVAEVVAMVGRGRGR